MRLRIVADGADTDVAALGEWLRSEPALRGRLKTAAAPPAPGTMGATSEFVLELAATAAGAAPMWAALGQSVSTWLSQRRRPGLTVTVHTSDGRTITVEASQAGEVEALLRDLIVPEATAQGEARGR